MPASPTHFDGTDFLVDPLDLGADTERPSTTDLVGIYRRSLGDCEPVTPERAVTLFAQVRAGDWRGDLKIEANALSARARAELIFSLLPMGLWFIRQFSSIPALDVIAICNLSVIKIVDHLTKVYDPAMGQLSSFAVPTMRRDLALECDRRRTTVTIPSWLFTARRQIHRARTALEAQGIAPTRERIAQDEHMSLTTVDTVDAVRLHDIGLSDPIPGDLPNEPMCFEEVITHPDAINPEDQFAKSEGADVVQQLLAQHLTARQFAVVELLYLNDEPMTSQQVATHLQVTPFAVEALRQAAHDTLRNVQGLRPLLRALSTRSRACGRPNLTALPVRLDKQDARVRRPHKFHYLTPALVCEIRRLVAEGATQKSVAKQFCVTESTISRVVRFRNRKADRS